MSPEQLITRTRHLRRSDHTVDYTDFIIKADGIEFPVHKVFLGRNSPFFHDIIFKEQNDGAYEFTRYSAETVEICLLYMYTKELEIGPHNVIDVMELTDHLNLHSAKGTCENFLKDNIHLGNCIQMRTLSTKYSLASLSESTNHLILNNAHEVATLRDIGDLSPFDMKSIGASANEDSEEMWMLFEAWSKQTRQNVCRAINVVPFGFFGTSKFKNTVWNSEHISICDSCMNIAAHQFLGSTKSVAGDMTPENLIFIKNLAREYGFDEVERLIHKHVEVNHKELLTSQLIEALSAEDLLVCISDVRDMCSPAEFTAIIQWMKNDPERQKIFKDIFYYVEHPDSHLECTFLSSLCVFVGFSESNRRTPEDEVNDDDDYWFPQHSLFLKELAKRYGCTRTENHVDECIIGEFVRVCHQPEFGNLQDEDLRKYLSARSTYDSGAVQVWQALIKWINCDFDARQVYFDSIFACLKLHEFTDEFMADEMLLTDLVLDSRSGLALIVREMLKRSIARQNS